jgi:hypothetical protein
LVGSKVAPEPDLAPSEAVSAEALRHSLPEFMQSSDDSFSFKKFLWEKSTRVETDKDSRKLA